MKTSHFVSNIELTNDGYLSLFFLGTGNAFTKTSFQTNLLVVKGQTHLLIDCGTLCSYAIENLYNGKIADIQKDANTDGLTNLLNRRAFDLELAHLIMIERPFSVIMGDIDRFKSLNDNYGHLMGDMALKAVAGIFLNSNRDGSSSYRYGGEEFVMLLPDTKMVVARQIAESMRRKVEKLSILSKETGTGVTRPLNEWANEKGSIVIEIILYVGNISASSRNELHIPLFIYR